jgi:dipeptidyl aminopeptidase/acylaminoacyl peptidase
VQRGTPPIPAALRARLGSYLDTRSAGLSWLSDDGRTALVTTRFGETSQVHLVRAPLGARTQVTFRPEPTSSASFVPGKTDAILFRGDVGGNEQYQIYRADLTTGQVARLTDGKSRHGDYVWSRDGRRIAYTSNARNGKDMDLYLGDGQSAQAEKLLLEREGHWYPIEFSPAGDRLLVGQYISINESHLYVVDVATAAVRGITPPTPKASYRDAAFGGRGDRIYATTDREGEFVELYEVELDDSAWRPLTRHLRWNVEEIAVSADGRHLAFVVNEDGYGVLRLLDTAARRERPAPPMPKGLVRDLHFARRAPVLGFTLMSPTQTGDAYTLDVRRGRLERWTESEMGGLDASRFVEPSLIRYPTFDGRQIPAFYFAPPGAGPHPVLVFIHGGPEAQARPYFSALVQYLAGERGIAVLVPNVRGSDGYGKSYLLLDNGYRREDSVRDIGALLDWIGKRKELDPQRVGVFGGSYGGYMVLASLVHYGDRIAAGVDYVGVSNFVTFLTNTKSYRRDLRRAEYGDERIGEMNRFLQKISPSNHADKIRSALFVAHGANDPRVPLSETDQLVAAVEKQGKDVWYLVANNEGHGFRKKQNRDLFYQLTVLFFDKHLRPNHP